MSKKGYFIANIEVKDPDTYAKYAEKVPPIVAQYGGSYLVRGGAQELAEGDGLRPRESVEVDGIVGIVDVRAADMDGKIAPRVLGWHGPGDLPDPRLHLVRHSHCVPGPEGAQLHPELLSRRGLHPRGQRLTGDEGAIKVALEQEDVLVLVIFECGAFEALAIEAAGKVGVVGLILVIVAGGGE